MDSPILQENEAQAVAPMSMEPTSKKPFLDNFTSRAVFAMGFVSCTVLVVAIGFVFLLTMTVKGGTFAIAMDGKKAGTVAAAPAAAAAPTQPTAAPAPTQPTVGNFRPVDDKDHIRGNKNAKITILEYSDLECPFCKQFQATMKQVMDNYKDNIRWVYRHFPLDSLHSKARKEAEASECAFEQGGDDAFWKFIDKVYEITPSNNGLDPAQLPVIAKGLGLDQKKFEDCLASGRMAPKVTADSNDGVTAGAQGTPYAIAIVGDQKVPIEGAYPFSDVKSIIDSINK